MKTTIVLNWKKDTPNKEVYQEQANPDGKPALIGGLYLSKARMPKPRPDTVTVTVEAK